MQRWWTHVRKVSSTNSTTTPNQISAFRKEHTWDNYHLILEVLILGLQSNLGPRLRGQAFFWRAEIHANKTCTCELHLLIIKQASCKSQKRQRQISWVGHGKNGRFHSMTLIKRQEQKKKKSQIKTCKLPRKLGFHVLNVFFITLVLLNRYSPKQKTVNNTSL